MSMEERTKSCCQRSGDETDCCTALFSNSLPLLPGDPFPSLWDANGLQSLPSASSLTFLPNNKTKRYLICCFLGFADHPITEPDLACSVYVLLSVSLSLPIAH